MFRLKEETLKLAAVLKKLTLRMARRFKRKLEMVDEDDLMIVEEVPSKQARMDGVRALSPGGG